MKPMRYISTRGQTAPMGFQEAVITGLAPDGGLLLPERIPDVRDRLADWAELDYADLACEVFRLFVDLPDPVLQDLVKASYAPFRDPAVTPVKPVGDRWVLELFHGPTLAFKDVALQFLSRFFAWYLEQNDRTLNILGATSGDTGSAAIHGVKGLSRLRIFMMHPRGRVAPLQERQMTTVLDDNVFNLAVSGTFDDCQEIMKALFEDIPFKQGLALGAVNSVNWARVMAQIVYYFHAAFRVQRATGSSTVRFSVPTGNFGDILAGWFARAMGLPADRLVLAANENDILSRFFHRGVYRRGEVVSTLSPAMDIQVASNFERYLYYREGMDPGRIDSLLQAFRADGCLEVKPGAQGEIDPVIRAGVGTRTDTLEAIRRVKDAHDYLLDPHSAVGWHVASYHLSDDVPMICLATAHPAKFPDAIREATGRDLAHHPNLDGLLDAPTRSVDLSAETDAVRTFLKEHIES